MNRKMIESSLICLGCIVVLSGVIGCAGGKGISVLSADEYYTRGRDFLQRNKNLNAITEFQGVVYNYPGDARVDSAQYFLALAYFNDKNFELATVEFDRLLSNYPSSPLAEASQFMKAAALFEGSPKSPSLDQTDLHTSVKQLNEFLTDNPESQFTPQVKEYLARGYSRLAARLHSSGLVYYRIRAYEASQRYFQQVIDEYTNTEYGPRATFYLAEVSYARKRFADAATQFSNFLSVYPEHPLVAKATKRLQQSKDGEVKFPQKGSDSTSGGTTASVQSDSLTPRAGE